MAQNLPSYQWANDTLTAQGFKILANPESVRETPWSQVARISTSEGYVYLKQMAPQFAVEPLVLQLLQDKLSAEVPAVIAHEITQRWFLMHDSGLRLRELLKDNYQTELVGNALRIYAELQIQAIDLNKEFLSLGVKDWRLQQLPIIYQQLLSQRNFLQTDGLSGSDIEKLNSLASQFEQSCEHLASFKLPETIEHGDFQDNNILMNSINVITINDWGDANITHPFFSLGSWLDSASRHHQMHADDPRRIQLINAYMEPWQQFAKMESLQNAFRVCERIRPVLFAINFCRVATCPGMEQLGQFKGYIADALIEFIKLHEGQSKDSRL